MAPEPDVQLARKANPVEVKPDPAPATDVEAMAKIVELQRTRDGQRSDERQEVRLANDREWNRPVRQWRPDWVEYDEFYRPIVLNPYRAPVRIVYVYQNLPRVVYVPPLARIVLDVAEFAAYSFTAVVLNTVNTAVNLVNAAVDTAVDVAVGTFFGGGYIPRAGLPTFVPPPLVRYDNVPVFVRYSQARYEPFRVNRIIDMGDDVRYGERRVLLDGVTPAWGVWNQTPGGERLFEVHRTQQFPGLDEPGEGPLPGNYQLRLASDNAAPDTGLSRMDVFLMAAGGTAAVMSLGALAFVFGVRRRGALH